MAWILLVDDGGRTRRMPLRGGPLVVGSDAAADVVLDHPTVSRRHARITLGDDGVRIADLGSSNGTRVDGSRLPADLDEGVQVAAGQTIHFGSQECSVESTTDDDLQPALDFGSAGLPSAPTGAKTSTATLSVGSVRDFVLTSLPGLVQRLEDLRKTPVAGDRATARLAVVHAAGRALFEAFPCRRIEIAILPREADESTDGAILFRAGETSAEGDSWTDGGKDRLRVRAGRLETRVRFTPGLHVAGVEPLVRVITRLAALDALGGTTPVESSDTTPETERAGDAPQDRSAQAEPVPLPTPPTVDPVVRKIYDDARRIARGDVGVLIAGESGTGKEVLAQFVHACSPRTTGELVALNCAALPQDLLEAELFGIEKGVATGVEARAGKFEQADGGTLFLDEIGDMAPATQAKILRVLQEGEVYRLGGRAPRPARVRVLAASNRDLGAMLESGAFRRDLFHRIADCRFTLPPLRERLGDLPNLAAHFLTRAASAQGVRVRGISKAALEALLACHWPGNVRQLEREMSRAALFLEDGELLQTRHLHDEIAGLADGERASSVSDRSLKARLERYERGVLIESLLRHDRNVRAAAEELGIGRTTLYRRIQELEIEL